MRFRRSTWRSKRLLRLEGSFIGFTIDLPKRRCRALIWAFKIDCRVINLIWTIFLYFTLKNDLQGIVHMIHSIQGATRRMQARNCVIEGD